MIEKELIVLSSILKISVRMVLEKEFEISVGKFEKHSISFYYEDGPDITVISVDDIEIFRSRIMNGTSVDMKIFQRGHDHQWMYTFIVGTQETHVIEIHVRNTKPSRKHPDHLYDYNVLVDGVLSVKKGKRLDPAKSGTRTDVTLETMSLKHFHLLSDVEKKLYARDILKIPNWRVDWVYVH